MMKLSIVSTLYQSAPYIQEFYRRVVDASKHLELEITMRLFLSMMDP